MRCYVTVSPAQLELRARVLVCCTWAGIRSLCITHEISWYNDKRTRDRAHINDQSGYAPEAGDAFLSRLLGLLSCVGSTRHASSLDAVRLALGTVRSSRTRGMVLQQTGIHTHTQRTRLDYTKHIARAPPSGHTAETVTLSASRRTFACPTKRRVEAAEEQPPVQ